MRFFSLLWAWDLIFFKVSCRVINILTYQFREETFLGKTCFDDCCCCSSSSKQALRRCPIRLGNRWFLIDLQRIWKIRSTFSSSRNDMAHLESNYFLPPGGPSCSIFPKDEVFPTGIFFHCNFIYSNDTRCSFSS